MSGKINDIDELRKELIELVDLLEYVVVDPLRIEAGKKHNAAVRKLKSMIKKIKEQGND